MKQFSMEMEKIQCQSQVIQLFWFKGASRANHMLPAMVCETPWWSP